MTTVPEALRKAADFLDANPDKRTHSVFARNEHGAEVTPLSDHATCWCALGRFALEAKDLFEPSEVAGFPCSFRGVDRLLGTDSVIEIYRRNDGPVNSETVTELLRTIADDLEKSA